MGWALTYISDMPQEWWYGCWWWLWSADPWLLDFLSNNPKIVSKSHTLKVCKNLARLIYRMRTSNHLLLVHHNFSVHLVMMRRLVLRSYTPSFVWLIPLLSCFCITTLTLDQHFAWLPQNKCTKCSGTLMCNCLYLLTLCGVKLPTTSKLQLSSIECLYNLNRLWH